MRKNYLELQKLYKIQNEAITEKINSFKILPEEEWLYELIFCLLTPQSNGKRCWEAVIELKKSNFQNIKEIIRTKTRFHNTKTKHMQKVLQKWPHLKAEIQTSNNPLFLRSHLYENIKGLGMKESSHFLRNIGKSNNQLAILDRHILKNLARYNVVRTPKILNQQAYLKIEEKMKSFSKKINIPLDHLDLLLWAKETGEIFK